MLHALLELQLLLLLLLRISFWRCPASCLAGEVLIQQAVIVIILMAAAAAAAGGAARVKSKISAGYDNRQQGHAT
jgi:hypothetical protein